MNIAVVLAGGVGSRFGKAYPKQFAKVAGKTLIEHTLDVFEINSDIDDVIVVSKGGFVDLIWEMVNKNGYHKIKSVISGGNERMDSTFNALEYIRDNYDATSDINLIIHDAVRPFVSDEIITACINELNIFDAVDVVINSADTIVEVDDDGNLVNIPERSKLRRGQTPQCFKFHVLYEAYVLAKAQENMKVTCDCGVLLQVMPHVKISTVHGHDTNIKITEPIDISIADYVFQQKGENRLSFLKKRTKK
ncbi:IspD/TarI family cytidylyltransferase [Vibrio panuliri]|uniref:IspD/TarI family cytidylyltransferase n=1 Tax=Vibrio panuliri TaxID=1381081 RepID=UPI0018D883CE|nr:IspD/TarI family cytidylyltransferase [Vibrio panuliri]